MRSMWKGSIQFGLVSVPVKLYLAVDGADSRFHLLHAQCGTRIQTRLWCPADDLPLTRDDTVRAFEVGPDRHVAFSEEELDSLPVRTLHTIDIEQMVDENDRVSLTRHSRGTYYLAPESIGARPYTLLRTVLSRMRLAALGRITLREREHLALIEPHGTVLLLTTLAWPSEVRSVADLDLPGDLDLRPAEVDLAQQLLAAMAAPFDGPAHRDAYAAALDALVATKVDGAQFVEPTVEPSPVMVDLVTALKRSLEERGPGPRPATLEKPSARKSRTRVGNAA